MASTRALSLCLAVVLCTAAAPAARAAGRPAAGRPLNEAPVVLPILDQTVAEGALLVVTPIGSDVDGDSLTWSGSNLPAGAAVDGVTGVLTWTPAYSQAGSYPGVMLTASDGALSSSQSFGIEVTDTPSSVVAAAAPSACVTPAHPCQTVPVTIAREDTTGARAFSVTIAVSPELELCAGTSSIVEGSYLSTGFTTDFQVTDEGGGTYTVDGAILGSPCGATAASGTLFTVAVTDVGASGVGSVRVTSVTLRDCANADLPVSAGDSALVTVDLAPVAVAAIGAQSVAEQATLNVSPSATLSACATGPVTWSMSGAPAGAALDSTTGAFTWTPACDAFQSGPSYGPVTLTATAASGDAGAASFTIGVTDSAGTVTVSVTGAIVEETSALAMAAPSAQLTGCAGGPVTWSASPALPAGAVLDSTTGVVAWTPACGQAGGYGPFTLTATAASGETGSDTFGLTVTHRTGAVLVDAIPDTTVAEGEALSIAPGATLEDCAASPLTWSAIGLPAGATVDSTTGTVSWTPDCAAFEAGPDYGPVTLTATAATGEFGSEAFSIHVTNTPNAVAAVSDLAASQVLAGNGPDGLTGIQVTFTLPGGASSIEVYRAGFGNYPEFDDPPSPGAPPAAPTYPPGAPWSLTAVTASGQSDEPSTRDVWYYVAFAKNACGDVSTASAVTGGALDYHLGDVTDGGTPGQGDNLVNTADISLLGAHYGLSGAAVLPYAYLDVGPTLDRSVDTRPTTDDRVNFEDLVVFAINYGEVGAPPAAARQREKPRPSGTGSPVVRLHAPAAPAVGETFTAAIEIVEPGGLQALSAQLGYDPAVVEPVAVEGGALLESQGVPGVVLSAAPGNADVALLGPRAALDGTGEIVRATFRVMAPGDARVTLAHATARDGWNQPLDVTVADPVVEEAAVPEVTYLGRISPNPSRAGTVGIAFGLHEAGHVRLAVYDVRGRLVRTLVDRDEAAGEKRAAWDGRAVHGRPASVGVYVVRLEAGGASWSRPVHVLP